MKKTDDEVIRNRRSTRSFTDYIVSDTELMEILSAGIMAPSGKDRRPWRFVIVRNREVIKSISKNVVYSRFIRHAPQVVLVYSMVDSTYPVEKDLIGIGACLENILLVATEKGYGSCVIGELFDKQRELAQYVNADTSGLKLVCGVVIGQSIKPVGDKTPLNVQNYVIDIVE